MVIDAQTERTYRDFDAQVIGIGKSEGIIIPKYVRKYAGLRKGQILRVQVTILADTEATDEAGVAKPGQTRTNDSSNSNQRTVLLEVQVPCAAITGRTRRYAY